MEETSLKIIQTHNFEEEKAELKRFSQQIPAELALPAVKEEGDWFGWGDHNVTGKELNERITEIQQYCIQNNKTSIETIKAFKHVYEAFEVLDKEYMAGITTAVRAAEEASNQAVRVSEQAKENSERTIKLQETQKKTLQTLVKRMDGLIAGITTAVQAAEEASNQVVRVSEQAKENSERAMKLQETQETQEKTLQTLVKHMDGLREERQTPGEELEILRRKLRIAYAVSGGAAMLTAIQLVLGLLGVL